MENSNDLYCYNKGCGQRFDPDKNAEDSCVHHPGKPVFHDAYKSWSCCDKKTTDFTDFLNIRGCKTSFHNGDKPPEEVKPKIDNSEIIEEECRLTRQPLSKKTSQTSERPNRNIPMVDLKFSVNQSLMPLLEKLELKEDIEELGDEQNGVVPSGTSCKNGGCRKRFECEADNVETCLYHTGQPVFHEGMKFWSCCVRRTSDFDAFLDQVGCTTGTHLWFKPKSVDEEKPSCRYDWYQTGPFVYVSVYAKLPNPNLSYVKANPVALRLHVVFGQEKQNFDLPLHLFGVITLEKCHVTYSTNKVEVKLKKAEPESWRHLTVPPSLARQENETSL